MHGVAETKCTDILPQSKSPAGSGRPVNSQMTLAAFQKHLSHHCRMAFRFYRQIKKVEMVGPAGLEPATTRL